MAKIALTMLFLVIGLAVPGRDSEPPPQPTSLRSPDPLRTRQPLDHPPKTPMHPAVAFLLGAILAALVIGTNVLLIALAGGAP